MPGLAKYWPGKVSEFWVRCPYTTTEDESAVVSVTRMKRTKFSRLAQVV